MIVFTVTLALVCVLFLYYFNKIERDNSASKDKSDCIIISNVVAVYDKQLVAVFDVHDSCYSEAILLDKDSIIKFSSGNQYVVESVVLTGKLPIVNIERLPKVTVSVRSVYKDIVGFEDDFKVGSCARDTGISVFYDLINRSDKNINL